MKRAVQLTIEGERFRSIKRLTVIARVKGFSGCDDTIYQRLKHGATTWAEIIAEPDAGFAAGGRRAATNTHDRKIREREEMRLMCAELDARKSRIENA